jgi:hypothetical protein
LAVVVISLRRGELQRSSLVEGCHSCPAASRRINSGRNPSLLEFVVSHFGLLLVLLKAARQLKSGTTD